MIFDIIIGGFRPFYRDFRDNFSDKWRTRTHPKINIFQISKYSSTPLNKPPQDLSVKEGLGGGRGYRWEAVVPSPKIMFMVVTHEL